MRITFHTITNEIPIELRRLGGSGFNMLCVLEGPFTIRPDVDPRELNAEICRYCCFVSLDMGRSDRIWPDQLEKLDEDF